MTAFPLLFLVIFLEGYAVLSTELLAIRQMTPFMGGGTDTVSVVIAAILMPLALGYHAGGGFKRYRAANGVVMTVRRKLLLNLSTAAAFLCLGLSYVIEKLFFETFGPMLHMAGRVPLAALYCAVFLVIPVYLMGQTVPLVSNYFRQKSRNPSHFAGKILFFSTLGSFTGALLCTLVLMAWIGVHNTVIVSIGCLALLVLLISGKKSESYVKVATAALLFTLLANNDMLMRSMGIVEDNQYNTARVFLQPPDTRMMVLNEGQSSAVFTNDTEGKENVFTYIQFVDDHFIRTISPWQPPKDILVIGAGGFTLGREDHQNNYVFVDIDPDLKNTAETVFLQRKLDPNKQFVPEEGRSFLLHTDRKFDLVFIDAFQSIYGSPEYFVTQEFFRAVKKVMKPDGILAINIIASPTFADAFSMNFDSTLRSVFPLTDRNIIQKYNGWDRNTDTRLNIIYASYNRPGVSPGIYTDNVNRSYMDKGLPAR